MNHTEHAHDHAMTAPHPPEPDWSLGWRYEIAYTAHGEQRTVRIPLTPEEARHPKEGYVMPERTEHDLLSDSYYSNNKRRNNCSTTPRNC